MENRMCPHFIMHVSSWRIACVHTLLCMCPQKKPKLAHGDKLNWSNYVGGKRSGYDRRGMLSPRVHTKHTYLPFLRGISHNKAINELRNLGMYPVNTRPTGTHPTYNNYNSVLYSYWVFYCEAEGYNKHHEMARRVLLYVFYAQVEFKGIQG